MGVHFKLERTSCQQRDYIWGGGGGSGCMPPPRTREILKFSFFKMQILRILREIYPNNWSSNVQLHAFLLLSVTDEILIISNSSVATG